MKYPWHDHIPIAKKTIKIFAMKTSIPLVLIRKSMETKTTHDHNLLIKAKRRQKKGKGLEARTKSKRAGL